MVPVGVSAACQGLSGSLRFVAWPRDQSILVTRGVEGVVKGGLANKRSAYIHVRAGNKSLIEWVDELGGLW